MWSAAFPGLTLSLLCSRLVTDSHAEAQIAKFPLKEDLTLAELRRHFHSVSTVTSDSFRTDKRGINTYNHFGKLVISHQALSREGITTLALMIFSVG